MLSVAFNPTNPGDSAVSLLVHEEEEEGDTDCHHYIDGGGRKRKKKPKPAPTKKGKLPQSGFKRLAPIENLEGRVAKAKTLLVECVRKFREREQGQGHRPPALSIAEEAVRRKEEEEEEGRKEGSSSSTTKSSKSEKQKVWNPAVAVTPANFLGYVQTLEWHHGQLTHTQILPGREARTVSLASVAEEVGMHPALKAVLEEKGIKELYSHQSDALRALMPGGAGRAGGRAGGEGEGPQPMQDVIITTATASGKSLCYTLPFLNAYLSFPSTTKALFIFPTKALAQDQLSSLQSLATAVTTPSSLPPCGIACYDGDTPHALRDHVRDSSSLLLLNPDMLHLSLLPLALTHPQWRAWLTHLKFIVIDEAHVYKGAFGAHVALVIRRLLRICQTLQEEEEEDEDEDEGRKGTSSSLPSSSVVIGPRVVLCSATISNPAEHMLNLTGRGGGREGGREGGVVVIDQDGSPAGGRVVGFWNPASVAPPSCEGEEEDEEGGREKEAVTFQRKRSPYKDTARLLAALVMRGLKTLVFVKVRYIAEHILSLTRAFLPPSLHRRLASYRAGYLPKERREVEEGLREGALLGVIATNALELGVDVGELDVTLHVGFPSTISSLWQQAGRAGRRAGGRKTDEGGKDQEGGGGEGGRASVPAALAVVIALDGPLDRYLIAHPHEVLSRAVEPAIADPFNPVCLEGHVWCSVWEMEGGGEEGKEGGGREGRMTTESELVRAFGKGGGEEAVRAAVDALVEAGKVVRVGNTVQLVGGKKRKYLNTSSSSSSSSSSFTSSPASTLAIRSLDNTQFQLLEHCSGRLLETMEGSKAFYNIHGAAIYLHQGQTYEVVDLDVEGGVATLERREVTYFTQPRDHTRVMILGTRVVGSLWMGEKEEEGEGGGGREGGGRRLELPLRVGPVKVVKQVRKEGEVVVDWAEVWFDGCACLRRPSFLTIDSFLSLPASLIRPKVYGYKVKDKKTSRITDVVELSLPPMEYDTMAVWTELPGEIKRPFVGYRHENGRNKRNFDRFDRGGLHAIEHVLCSLAPMEVRCDPSDLSCQHTRRDGDLHRDKLLLFETARGGTGLAQRLGPALGRLLKAAHKVVSECGCAEGCHGCIVLGSCYEEGLDKEAAKEILTYLVQGGSGAGGERKGESVGRDGGGGKEAPVEEMEEKKGKAAKTTRKKL